MEEIRHQPYMLDRLGVDDRIHHGIDQDGTKVVQWGASATSAVLSIWALCYFAQSARKESFVGSVMKGGSTILVASVLAAVLYFIIDPDYTHSEKIPFEGTLDLTVNSYIFRWVTFSAAYVGMIGYLFGRDLVAQLISP